MTGRNLTENVLLDATLINFNFNFNFNFKVN